jgi:hypothetical protein
VPRRATGSTLMVPSRAVPGLPDECRAELRAASALGADPAADAGRREERPRAVSGFWPCPAVLHVAAAFRAVMKVVSAFRSHLTLLPMMMPLSM